MNALPKWRVYYNTHAYRDCSDTPRSTNRIVSAPSADEAREVVRRMERSGRRFIGMVHQAEPYEDPKTLRPADAEDVSTETLMPLFHPANGTIKAMSTIIWNTTPPDESMPPATRVLVVWRGVVYAGVYFSRSRTVTLYPESDGKSVDIGNCTAWARWPMYYLPTVAEEQETKRLTLLHGDGV